MRRVHLMNSRAIVALTVLAGALGANGCFKLARTSPPVERYVVGGAMLTQSETAGGDSADLAIGLRRLDLAPYLATLAIVVRRADNQIVTTGFHRWAEGPTTGLNRAVSGYLGNAPGIRSVDVAPWPIRSTHDYVVQMHVRRFEGVESERGAEAHLLASWEIIRAGDGALVARGTTDYRARDWRIDDYAGLVSRLDLGLVTMSRDIVACLRQLGPAAAMVPADSVTDASPRGTTLECSSQR